MKAITANELVEDSCLECGIKGNEVTGWTSDYVTVECVAGLHHFTISIPDSVGN